MLFGMIAALLITMTIAVLLVWALLWAARLYVHRYLALVIGLIVIGYLVQNIVNGMIFCAQEPVFIPPTDGGEGMMKFNCDAPFGIADRLYLYVVGPVLVLISALLTYRFSRPLRPVVM